MSTIGGSVTRSYDPTAFVDRQPELEKISRSVRQAIGEARRIEWPVINFWGVTGTGKSWLLQHLHHLYRYPARVEKPTIALIYGNFSQNKNELSGNISQSLGRQLEQQLPLELEQSDKLNSALQQALSGNIHGLVHALLECEAQNFVPVILLDNTELIEPEVWQEIEQQLIEPLVVSGRILFIISGRRYIPRWRRYEVRRRVQDPHDTHLQPFSEKSVKELIQNRQYNVEVDILLPLTAGNPRLVDELGRLLHNSAQGEEINRTFIEQRTEQILPVLQQYEQDLLTHVPQNLHDPLRAIIPLRVYRMEALRFMLERESAEKYGAWREGDYLRTLRDLDQTEIVWWNKERRAYTTDDIARRIINQRQSLADKEEFVRWHRNAVNLYLQWANEHKATSEEFILEAWFHLANIHEVNSDWPELLISFEKTLDIARQLNTDRKLVIIEQLETHDKDTEYDSELYKLLPDAWRHRALDLVNSIDTSMKPND
jgi:hypothetical protein